MPAQEIQIGRNDLLVKGLASKVGQHESSAVDVRVVVAAETLLLLAGPGAEGLLDIAGGVLAADHEADLAGGVGGDGGVGVLGDGEDLTAGLLQVGDQGKVQPLVLGYKQKSTVHRTEPIKWVGCRIVQKMLAFVLQVGCPLRYPLK